MTADITDPVDPSILEDDGSSEAVYQLEVSSYDDLADDEVLRSRAKDAVVKELEAGAEAVLWLDDWLVPEKSLEPIDAGTSGLDQIVVGRVVASTDGDEDSEGAYLFTTLDVDDPPVEAPGTDWVPREYTRLYEAGDSIEDDVPQRGLSDFADR